MIDWSWKEVDELENNEEWDKAFNVTLVEWRCNPFNLKILIRLAFLCWNLLDYWHLYNPKNLDQNEVQSVLDEVTEFGFNNFSNNIELLWTFGYMIHLFPYMFGDYDQMENQAIEMLKQAYLQDNNDLVIKVLYLATYKHKEQFDSVKKEYEHSCLSVEPLLRERFKGDGALASYFRRVLAHRV